MRNDILLQASVLGIALNESNQAAARWALKDGGEYYGVGAGVGISGFRADLEIVDDPFGSREDAWSETIRQKRWDWYIRRLLGAPEAGRTARHHAYALA